MPNPTPTIIAARQRTHAIVVICAIQQSREVLEDALATTQPHAVRHLSKVARWEEACLDALGVGQGKLSSGMQRDYARATDALNAIRQRHTGGGCTTLVTWSGWVVALDALLTDMRACWPSARHGHCWRWLAQTWDTWTRSMLKAAAGETDPHGRDAEEIGASIYLDAAELITFGAVEVPHAS